MHRRKRSLAERSPGCDWRWGWEQGSFVFRAFGIRTFEFALLDGVKIGKKAKERSERIKPERCD
jgi:hypothetical protein